MEAKKIFLKHKIKVYWKKVSLQEPDLENLEQIAKHKALTGFKKIGKPLIVEDTSIFFKAYKNFPGQFAKRMFKCLGYEGLLKLLEGKKRSAFFETIAVYYNGKKFLTGKGILKGKITTKVFDKKKDVLPYEKIFLPEGFNKPLSSISRKEKNTFSHRFKAFNNLAKKIVRQSKQ